MVVFGCYGRASSGKTTASKYVSRKIEGMGYVVEGVREILERKQTSLNFLRKDTSKYLDFQYEVMDDHLSNLSSAIDKFDNVISDRTILDIYVYTKLYVGEAEAYELFKWYEGLKEYDYKLFFTPLPYIKDGVREDDKIREEAVEFHKLKSYADITITNKNKRKQQVLGYVEGILKGELELENTLKRAGKL